MTAALLVDRVDELDRAALLAVIAGRRLQLGDGLLAAVAVRRSEVLTALRSGDAVYGVTTGMGAASEVRLDETAQGLHQQNLMLARSVGGAPWLSGREARAALAVRLRTFLVGDAGVSAELCLRLVDLLNRGLVPAIPRTGHGAAGEIIALAHLGAALTGAGEFLSGDSSVRAAAALTAAGLSAFPLGPKEGVALIEGIPVTTGLAILCSRDAGELADQATAILAAELALTRVNRDPFAAVVARADAELASVLRSIRALAGESTPPRALQAPVSFRVAPGALAALVRSIDGVERATQRALDGVTDSPAFLDGRFTGTAGFDGFDLASSLDALRVCLVHLAGTSVARMHRLLDEGVTGLPRQLSDRPGLHAGLVAVHKRAVGELHLLLGRCRPASLGAVETSLGQEDVQSFSIEAAATCADAIVAVRSIFACELLAVLQAARLAPGPLRVAPALRELLAELSAPLPTGTADRPFGRDLAAITRLLASGWANGVLAAEPPSSSGQ